jgi:hypothetical protein
MFVPLVLLHIASVNGQYAVNAVQQRVSDAFQGATVWERTAPINFLFSLLVTSTRGRDRAVRQSIWLGSVTGFAHPQ